MKFEGRKSSWGRVGSPSRPENRNDSHAVRDIDASLEGGSESRPYLRSAKPSRLWLWIVAVFLLQALAWAAWFTIAARHPVQEVPLATTPAR